ncbi:MAG: GIY-YIG nuclease family protein [Methyloglobulus sp.]
MDSKRYLPPPLTDMQFPINSSPSNWSVYMILCSDNSIYTGITNNLPRRFKQHCDQQGAKYFRGRQPVKIVYVEQGHGRSSASKRESAIKKLNHNEKLLLIESVPQKN